MTMIGLFNIIQGNLRKSSLLALALSAGLAGLAPTVARADEPRYGDRYGKDYRYGDERRYDRSDRGRDTNRWRNSRDRSDFKIDIDINTGRTRRESEYRPRYTERRVRYWVEPVYRTVSERVWIEPVYRTVTERIWVAPVYKTIYEVIDVPARYEVRETVRYSGNRKIVTRERTLIEPAHTDRIAREVCVSEGRWETITRQVCVSEGRWNVVERRVCVSEGRWDYRVERVEFTGREEQTRLDFRY
jgi:hypothetical protein